MKIRYIGDPILRKKAEPITEFDQKLKHTVEQMVTTMHLEDGIGLAAPQVGLSKRLLVVDISPIVKNEKPQACINPEILDSEGECVEEEGCLSIPDVMEMVVRPESVTVAYQNVEGEKKVEKLSGWKARVVQHEIDHLNGILFIDRISPLKRQMHINKGRIPATY
ncbi:MAG: peptide deformylase [Calditrichaceae bacterium]|nr:peptide deformylase [Calditrichaceae bacterium]MBN2708851.1 peptide deformylase [Calditrichaceae bacterium]RQV97622.1 MAG: peptide deformylase [Calditrichota bacterium]